MMDLNCDLVSCKQLSGAYFVVQTAGKLISTSVEFPICPGVHVLPSNSLLRPLGPCGFSAQMSYPEAYLLKLVLRPPSHCYADYRGPNLGSINLTASCYLHFFEWWLKRKRIRADSPKNISLFTLRCSHQWDAWGNTNMQWKSKPRKWNWQIQNTLQ